MIAGSSPESVPEIVVIGSCNVDLITYTERFPVVGETIEAVPLLRRAIQEMPQISWPYRFLIHVRGRFALVNVRLPREFDGLAETNGGMRGSVQL